MRLSEALLRNGHKCRARITLFCVVAFCVHCGEPSTDIAARPESLPPFPPHEVRSYTLVCPSGTEQQGEMPPKDLEQACVKTATDGKKVFHGPYRSWYSSKIKEMEGEYRDGLRQGVWFRWYPDGTPASKGFYDQGRREGEWVLDVPEDDFYQRFFVTYHDDVENGSWRRLHPTPPGVEPRFAAEEGYNENGKRQGTWKTYYPSGHLYAEGEYVLGELQGPAKYRHESGDPMEEGLYQHDLREGEWKEWDDRAPGYRKGVYVAGKKEGPWSEYDATEHVVKVTTYKAGEVVATETPKVTSAPTATKSTQEKPSAKP